MESQRLVGYGLLAIGLVMVIIPAYFGLAIIFHGAAAIPKILQAPVLSNNPASSNTTAVISTSNLNQIIGSLWPAVNVGLLEAVALVLIYAGGVIMSRGVSLIKETDPKASGEYFAETKKETPAEPQKQQEQPGSPPSPPEDGIR